ncbi:MAG: ABC transporter ATP-binding protein/permease [Defluviitaleaceae bacterium]|nr:ABC transporter ATP-binding protein/permease [Defluviitaleaceae bacterium]
MKTFIETLRRNNIRYRVFLLFYILSSVIVALGIVLMTRLRGDLGEAAYNRDMSLLIRFLITLTVVAAIRAVFAALSALFLGRFAGAAGHKLRHNFVGYFLRLPYSKFEKAGTGESLSIYSNDIPLAEQLIGGGWGGGLHIISSVLEFIAALIFMFATSPLLSLIVLGLIPLLVGVQVLGSKPIEKRQIIQSERIADFNAVVNDSLQNISTIAAYSLEDVLEERYLEKYDSFIESVKKFLKALILSFSIGLMTSVLPLAIILIVAAVSVINQNMTIAEFIAYSAMLVLVGEWLGSLSENLGHLQVAIGGSKRLRDNTSEESEPLHEGAKLDGNTGIFFENVSFAYNEESPPALNDINLAIKPGTKIAFVGGSGSGKSTLLKLLLGLYEPTSGEIVISGNDATKLAKTQLRDIFAYVPQDSFLFPESIGENITLETKASNSSRLEKACSDAGILDFINSLPDGFDSILTESSDNISGGQRQRIAMARAFYKDAPIILFDEATAALDPTTEASILQSFDNVAQGKTVIMVAHRARAIAACDTIVVMDSGKISGIGTHDELLANNEIYRNLYHAGGVA